MVIKVKINELSWEICVIDSLMNGFGFIWYIESRERGAQEKQGASYREYCQKKHSATHSLLFFSHTEKMPRSLKRFDL